jgi:hypothetical protein
MISYLLSKKRNSRITTLNAMAVSVVAVGVLGCSHPQPATNVVQSEVVTGFGAGDSLALFTRQWLLSRTKEEALALGRRMLCEDRRLIRTYGIDSGVAIVNRVNRAFSSPSDEEASRRLDPWMVGASGTAPCK